jgi:hypothetical protein
VETVTSLRLILATASKEDLGMVQQDINSASLYGDLEDFLYVERTVGFLTSIKKKICAN